MLVVSIIYPHFDRFRIAKVGKGNACVLVRVVTGVRTCAIIFCKQLIHVVPNNGFKSLEKKSEKTRLDRLSRDVSGMYN